MAKKPYSQLTPEQRGRANQAAIASKRRRRARDEEYAADQKLLMDNYWRGNPRRVMLYHARRRAAKKGLPCTITIEHIVIPEYCPVLGIKLKRGKQSVSQHSSPSLDRIRPKLGYVPGNIVVMSSRANRLKCDCVSGEELRVVAAWLDKALGTGQ